MIRFRVTPSADVQEIIVSPDDVRAVMSHYDLTRSEAYTKMSLRAARLVRAVREQGLDKLKPAMVDAVIGPVIIGQLTAENGPKLKEWLSQGKEKQASTSSKVLEDVKILDALTEVMKDPATDERKLERWVMATLYPMSSEELEVLRKISEFVTCPPARVKGGVYWQTLAKRYRSGDRGLLEAAADVVRDVIKLKNT